MGKRYFITGTDTDCGKTTIACELLQYFNQRGFRTVGIKPVASGIIDTPEGPRHADALLLHHHASLKLSYEIINPFVFEPPIAPHLAAAQQGNRLSVQQVLKALAPALSSPADIFIIEGAGGWLVPLNETETLADLAGALQAEIILVVSMKLGCLNHALLTAEALMARHLPVAGWIANIFDKTMLDLNQNIQTLQQRLPFPYLGIKIEQASLQVGADRGLPAQ